MGKLRRLGDAELEIMQIIWAYPDPMTSNEILKRLKNRVWQLSTLMTVLNRLDEKGFLKCDRTLRTNMYSATIKEGEYNKSESEEFLGRLYGSSLRRFVTSFCGANDVSKEELFELRDYLDSFAEE